MPPTFRSELLRVFGQDFGPARWQRPATALRFELGVGDDRSAYLATASERCIKLMTAVFAERPVLLELTLWSDDELARLRTLEHLARHGGPTPSGWERTTVTYDDDGPVTEHRASVRTILVPELLSEMVRFVVTADHGGRAEGHIFDLFVFDPDRGLLFDPYDSRGADLYSPTPGAVRAFYDRFAAWLLDHDRDDVDLWMSGATPPPHIDPLAGT